LAEDTSGLERRVEELGQESEEQKGEIERLKRKVERLEEKDRRYHGIDPQDALENDKKWDKQRTIEGGKVKTGD